jgi:Family of unknown function (DUF6463)
MRFVRSVGISGVPPARFVSPGYAIMLVGVGHAIWGLIAYHDHVWDLLRAGFVGSVGDGIFDTADAQGPRAVAFWFLLTAPFLVLSGYLVEAAIRARDQRALLVAGIGLLAIGLVGVAVIPASGFWAGIGIGCWLVYRGRSGRHA